MTENAKTRWFLFFFFPAQGMGLFSGIHATFVVRLFLPLLAIRDTGLSTSRAGRETHLRNGVVLRMPVLVIYVL
jgi:hypothetical protein